MALDAVRPLGQIHGQLHVDIIKVRTLHISAVR
jgi:hypothetical protein